jgi:hypothetical protein
MQALQARSAIDQALTTEVRRTAERLALATQAQNAAEHAKRTSIRRLAQQRAREESLLRKLRAEVEEWRRERDEFENLPEQRALAAERREYMDRVNQRADAARHAARAHAQTLLDEVAVILGNPDQE